MIRLACLLDDRGELWWRFCDICKYLALNRQRNVGRIIEHLRMKSCTYCRFKDLQCSKKGTDREQAIYVTTDGVGELLKYMYQHLKLSKSTIYKLRYTNLEKWITPKWVFRFFPDINYDYFSTPVTRKLKASQTTKSVETAKRLFRRTARYIMNIEIFKKCTKNSILKKNVSGKEVATKTAPVTAVNKTSGDLTNKHDVVAVYTVRVLEFDSTTSKKYKHQIVDKYNLASYGEAATAAAKLVQLQKQEDREATVPQITVIDDDDDEYDEDYDFDDDDEDDEDADGCMDRIDNLDDGDDDGDNNICSVSSVREKSNNKKLLKRELAKTNRQLDRFSDQMECNYEVYQNYDQYWLCASDVCEILNVPVASIESCVDKKYLLFTTRALLEKVKPRFLKSRKRMLFIQPLGLLKFIYILTNKPYANVMISNLMRRFALDRANTLRCQIYQSIRSRIGVCIEKTYEVLNNLYKCSLNYQIGCYIADIYVHNFHLIITFEYQTDKIIKNDDEQQQQHQLHQQERRQQQQQQKQQTQGQEGQLTKKQNERKIKQQKLKFEGPKQQQRHQKQQKCRQTSVESIASFSLASTSSSSYSPSATAISDSPSRFSDSSSCVSFDSTSHRSFVSSDSSVSSASEAVEVIDTIGYCNDEIYARSRFCDRRRIKTLLDDYDCSIIHVNVNDDNFNPVNIFAQLLKFDCEYEKVCSGYDNDHNAHDNNEKIFDVGSTNVNDEPMVVTDSVNYNYNKRDESEFTENIDNIYIEKTYNDNDNDKREKVTVMNEKAVITEMLEEEQEFLTINEVTSLLDEFKDYQLIIDDTKMETLNTLNQMNDQLNVDNSGVVDGNNVDFVLDTSLYSSDTIESEINNDDLTNILNSIDFVSILNDGDVLNLVDNENQSIMMDIDVLNMS